MSKIAQKVKITIKSTTPKRNPYNMLLISKKSVKFRSPKYYDRNKNRTPTKNSEFF